MSRSCTGSPNQRGGGPPLPIVRQQGHGHTSGVAWAVQQTALPAKAPDQGVVALQASTWARRSRTPPPNARLMVAPASETWGVDVDGERAFPGWPATWRSSGGASLPRSSRATGLAGPTSQSERERVGMGGNGLPYTGVSPRGGTGCRARLHQTRRASIALISSS